jgi:hypothetical protein
MMRWQALAAFSLSVGSILAFEGIFFARFRSLVCEAYSQVSRALAPSKAGKLQGSSAFPFVLRELIRSLFHTERQLGITFAKVASGKRSKSPSGTARGTLQ